MTTLEQRRAYEVAQCLELAILLEASAHKPGNVSVVTNFENTRYEHFLASAVAASPSFKYAATQGLAVLEKRMKVTEVGLGNIIKNCVSDIARWQHGGNTLLGTIILFSPIAVAAGMTTTEGSIETELRRNVKRLVESTTPEDAANLYEAIKIANPSGLGTAPRLDVNDPDSIDKILHEKTSLYDVFKIAEKYDTICSEWVNNYPITFDVAYPSLDKQIRKSEDLNAAIIQTFLEVLAEYPDTFIARKAGLKKAEQMSLKANEILSIGGPKTIKGKRSLTKFDQQLRESSNILNPGTTADIIATALALCVLGGYRP